MSCCQSNKAAGVASVTVSGSSDIALMSSGMLPSSAMGLALNPSDSSGGYAKSGPAQHPNKHDLAVMHYKPQ